MKKNFPKGLPPFGFLSMKSGKQNKLVSRDVDDPFGGLCFESGFGLVSIFFQGTVAEHIPPLHLIGGPEVQACKARMPHSDDHGGELQCNKSVEKRALYSSNHRGSTDSLLCRREKGNGKSAKNDVHAVTDFYLRNRATIGHQLLARSPEFASRLRALPDIRRFLHPDERASSTLRRNHGRSLFRSKKLPSSTHEKHRRRFGPPDSGAGSG